MKYSEKLANRIKTVGSRLCVGIDPRPELSGGVCITVVDGERARSREVMNQLYQEHGIAGAPTGGLRLCPHAYNTMEHVERAIAGVKAILT